MPQRFLVALLLLLVCPAVFGAAVQGGPLGVPLPLFPANNWWNADISAAPTQSGANAMLAGSFQVLEADLLNVRGKADFGGNDPDVMDAVYGFPISIVEGDQP